MGLLTNQSKHKLDKGYKSTKIIILSLAIVFILLCITTLVLAIYKSPYEKLVELYEIKFDIGGKYEKKYSKAKTQYEREKLAEERKEKINGLKYDLNIHSNDIKHISSIDEIKSNCNLSSRDIKKFLENYSLESLFELMDDDFIFTFLYELYPDQFTVVKCNDLPETTPETYYYDNPNAEPSAYTSPYDESRDNTCTVTFHGDFAFKKETRWHYTDGKLGWYNGKFYDEPGSYYANTNGKLYYKGKELLWLTHDNGYSRARNYDYTYSTTVYILTYENEEYIGYTQTSYSDIYNETDLTVYFRKIETE